MTTRTETRQIRLAQWRKVFQQKAESGLTAKEFYTQNNISKDSYYYWLNLVRQDALAKVNQPALVELKTPILKRNPVNSTHMDQPNNSNSLSIVINGATIKVNSETSKELLSMVLEVVSNA